MSEQPRKKNWPPLVLHGAHGPLEKLNTARECFALLRPETCTMRPSRSRASMNAIFGYVSTITPPLLATHVMSTEPELQ